MPIQTTYSSARANLAKLCDEVAENQRIVIISRRGRHDVALISADELSGLLEIECGELIGAQIVVIKTPDVISIHQHDLRL